VVSYLNQTVSHTTPFLPIRTVIAMKLQKCLKKLSVLRVWLPRVGSYGGASVDGLDDASEGCVFLSTSMSSAECERQEDLSVRAAVA
jgi:hypothetical protein